MKLPTAIGRYQIVDRIGSGGMGTLYLARDPAFERLVAIKQLREGLDDEELRERFAREARSAGRLHHRHIVTMFDVGEHEGQPFIAMEYIVGETLAALIRRRAPLSLTSKLEIAEAVCNGLAYAHRAGIIHRDIKPANIIVGSDGVVKILDFGIARAADTGQSHTVVVGTLNYMSPEQVAGRPDSRTDIFAMGAVLYELLTARQAFPGGLSDGVLEKVLHAEPEPLHTLMPSLPSELGVIVERALKKEAASRYQDFTAMEQDIARVRQQLTDSSGETWVVPRDGAEPRSASTPTPASASTPRRKQLEERRAKLIDQLLVNAEAAFAAAEYQRALDLCEQGAIINPDDARVMQLMDRARAELDGLQVRQWLADARAGLDRGDVTAAAALVSQALALAPDSTDATALRRQVQQIRREQERALERAQLLRVAIGRARESFAAGEFNGALRAVNEALGIDGSCPDAIQVRADVLAAIEGRRLREEQQYKAEQCVEEARREFEAGKYGAALARLDRFGPPHEAVSRTRDELQRRFEETERERVEKEDHERRARAAANDARLAEFSPPHEIVDRMLQQLRAEAEEIERARHEEVRRREKAEEVRRREAVEHFEEARRRCAANDYSAAIEHLEAVSTLGVALTGAVELLAEAASRRAAQDEAAQARRDAHERLVEAVVQTDRGDLSAARESIDAAASVDPTHPDLPAVRTRLDLAVAAYEAAERRRHAKTLVDRAREVHTHRVAIELLRQALELDPQNSDGLGLLSIRAEQQRLARIAEARNQIEGQLAQGDLGRAEQMLEEIDADIVTSREFEQVVSRVAQLRQRAEHPESGVRAVPPAPSDEGPLPTITGSARVPPDPAQSSVRETAIASSPRGLSRETHPPKIDDDLEAVPSLAKESRTGGPSASLKPMAPRYLRSIAISVTPVLVVGGLWLWSRGLDTSVPVPGPADRPQPVSQPAAPPQLPPAPPEPSPESPLTPGRVAAEAATRAHDAGRQGEALGIVKRALATSPADPDLMSLIARWLTLAGNDVTVAREGAQKSGAPGLANAEYAGAERGVRDSAQMEARGALLDALVSLRSAASLFKRAMQQSQTAANVPPQQPVAGELPSPVTPSVPSNTPVTNAAASTAVLPPTSTPRTPASVAPVPTPSPEPVAAPPVATPSATPPTVTAPPAVTGGRGPERPQNDESAIVEVMRQYEAAYESLDAGAVSRLQPNLSQDELARVFRQYRSYAMTVSNLQMSISGGTATINCDVTVQIRPRVGDAQSFTRRTVLRLQQTGDSWIIVERR